MAIKGVVSDQTVNAIKEYEKAGGKFVVCTGRTPSSIKARALQYGFPTFVACHQGSLLTDVATGEIIYNGGVDHELASRVISVVGKEYDVIAYVGDELLYQTDCRYVQVLSKTSPCTRVNDLAKEILIRGEKVNRIIISTIPELVESLIDKYTQIFGKDLYVNSGASYIVEFVSKKHSKKQAVEFLAKYYDFPYSQIMTVGDSTNDSDNLERAALGLAVKNAHPALLQIADRVICSNDEHIAKYILENIII
jgi:Cof subfamily protein (haloacid dehalogenase superfamily)